MPVSVRNIDLWAIADFRLVTVNTRHVRLFSRNDHHLICTGSVWFHVGHSNGGER
jgi:hypothetical protein